MSWINTILSSLRGLLFPRYCCVCGRRITPSEGCFCIACSMMLPRTGYQNHPYDNYLAQLFWGRFPIERAASWFFYRSHGDVALPIYDLKYHERIDVGIRLGEQLAKEFIPSGFFNDIDLLVPLPLAKKREHWRGYNQSEILAQGISMVTGIPIAPHIVERTSFSKSQTTMTAHDRADNVANVFRLVNAEAVKGRHILLIDDVITTGATIKSCAKEICKAHNVKISVLSVAFAKH